jgi:tetratricopeptide (TPR) repeat protein
MLWLAPSLPAQAQPTTKRKPAPAAAPAPGPADDSYRAQLHLSRAGELFQQGLYDEVVDELQEAYRLTPLPRILCNIAQAYRKGGRQKEAADQYDLCLRLDPKLTPQERAEFTEYREAALAALALVATPPTEAGSAKPAAPSPSAPAPPVPTPPPAEKRPIYKRAWFWGVLGTVVVVGAVTTGILVWQLSKPDPVSLLPPGTPLLRF